MYLLINFHRQLCAENIFKICFVVLSELFIICYYRIFTIDKLAARLGNSGSRALSDKYMAFLDIKPTLNRNMFRHISGIFNFT